MSKKLPKYKKDALNFLLNWGNIHFSTSSYTKVLYSEEHASITLYPNVDNLPEIEIGLNYNVKGRVLLSGKNTGKVEFPVRLDDYEVSKLTSSVSQILQKVPFNYRGEYGNERSIGFHYSTHNGVLSVMGNYNNQYMYPGN